MTFHPDTLPDLKGKVYIVTGGNSGIGYYTVSHLAEHGAHVYLCARSVEKGTAAIAAIQKAHPGARVDLLQMDHLDLASVVAAARRVLAAEPALHGLVNNAGIMATPLATTRDGHEAQWQTNYLAHWVLTEHLLPRLRRTAAASPPGAVRIVNLSSSGHLAAPRGGIHFADLALAEGGPWPRYGQSKLANILHTRTLQRAYGPGSPASLARGEGGGEIWVSSVHPGIVGTNLTAGTEAGFAMRTTFSLLHMVGMQYPADKGAWTSLFCVAGPDMTAEQSGGEPFWRSAAAKDEKLAERLEEWTRGEMRKEGWVQ
ncbi:uncharacterized protein PG998_012831 [Apiospora kogelbergensis]|uniref:uncharacterized protein n=1 Tax=Apiospora kogelbergensis TaxID=1337665 RepID=UPI00312E76FD